MEKAQKGELCFVLQFVREISEFFYFSWKSWVLWLHDTCNRQRMIPRSQWVKEEMQILICISWAVNFNCFGHIGNSFFAHTTISFVLPAHGEWNFALVVERNNFRDSFCIINLHKNLPFSYLILCSQLHTLSSTHPSRQTHKHTVSFP